MFDKSTSSSDQPKVVSDHDEMSITIANVDTNQERMAELKIKVGLLMKTIKERYYEIASLNKRTTLKFVIPLNQVKHL